MVLETTAVNTMVEAVGNGLTSIIGWFGDVIKALTGADGALAPLLPLFAIGISISVVMIVVKLIRSVSWGA